MKRCHAVSDWEYVSTCWSVIQYKPGQAFKSHYDFADEPGLRRTATLIAYLWVLSSPSSLF